MSSPPSCFLVPVHRLDDIPHFLFLHTVKHRQAQDGLCHVFGDGEIAFFATEVLVAFGEVRRDGIVDDGLDVVIFEVLLETVAVIRLDDELVPDVIRIFTLLWQADGGILDARKVRSRNALALGVELFQVAELRAQERGLQLVKARVDAENLVVVFLLAAIVAQYAERLREFCIICHDGTGVAECAEVLRRVETEAARITERARHRAAELRAMRLGTILDEAQVICFRDAADIIHLCGLAVEVDDHDGLCLRRDGRLDARGVERETIIRLDKDRRRTIRRDGEDGRDIGVGRHEDFVPRPDAERAHRERQRVKARADADAVFPPDIGRERLLKRLDLGAEHVPAAPQHAQRGGLVFLLIELELPPEHSEINLHVLFSPSSEIHRSRGYSRLRYRAPRQAP